jgi:hypothetical protein
MPRHVNPQALIQTQRDASEQEWRTVTPSTRSHPYRHLQFRAPKFADSLGLSQFLLPTLELESPLPLATARPLTRAGRSLDVDVVSASRAHRRKGKTSPWPAADWSVVCGWSTRSAAGLAVRAARRSSAVTVVRWAMGLFSCNFFFCKMTFSKFRCYLTISV